MFNQTASARTVAPHPALLARIAGIPLWEKIGLGAVVLIAAFFNFFQLTNNGLGNLYYATAVRSMLTSWHAFFFVSLDPGGFVAVDKPPVGLWLQAISAKIFGFGSFGLLFPQALAGIGAVVVLYYLVRGVFGAPAGLLAGLILALTPVLIVASRDNILDSILVLVVLLATVAVSKAAATGDLRWLTVGAVLVGIGFNVKMLEAYLVVPALGLVYLLAAPLTWRQRIGQFVVAGVIMAVISLSWSVAVDLTPAAQRPYVGSSQTNSEIELAFGYNGIQRLTGFLGGGHATGATTARFNLKGFTAFETGPAGIARLFDPLLGQQASWLLPLALLGLLATGWDIWPRTVSRVWRNRAWAQEHWRDALAAGWQAFVHIRLNPRQQAFTLWGMWLVTMGTFFSVASFFHPYYLAMLAPAVAALAAIGAVLLWRDFVSDHWQGWLLPLAIVATGVEQWHILAGYAVWDVGLAPLVMILSGLVAALLVVLRLSRMSQLNARARAVVATITARWTQATALYQPRLSLGVVATGIGLAVLLLTPTIWAYRSRDHAGMLPSVGPIGNGIATLTGAATVDPKLVSYLRTHRNNTKFLVATASSNDADPLILTTGQPVMALGGFSGGDTILTTSALQKDVANGTVRYFLVQRRRSLGLTPAQIAELPPQIQAIFANRGGRGGFDGFGAASKLTTWVTTACAAVPSRAWSSQAMPRPGNDRGSFPGSGGFPSGGFGRSGGQQLYDCGPAVPSS